MLQLLLVALLALSSVSVISAQCTDVHVVFARGTSELPGLGMCGKPLVSELTSNLPGKTVSSHAVVYAAAVSQTSAGPGATAMTKHIVEYAAQCPNAVFVIGGYSQGGTVTDIAIGIKTVLGNGEAIPTELAPRIKAVVTFGNPLKLLGQTIEKASPTYGAKAIEFCNTGDPVCGGGANMLAHMTYASGGSVAKAAQRAAQLVGSGGGGTSSAGGGSTDNAQAAQATSASDGAAGRLGGLSSLLNKGDSGTKGSGLSGLLSGGRGGGMSGLSGLLSGGGGGRSLPNYDFGNLRGSD